jgi:hypothetical protein
LALSCLMAHAASVAPVAAENGMVVTAQHLATHVGVDVLKAAATPWMPPWRWATRWRWSIPPPATSAAAVS